MPTKKLRMVLTWIDIHQEKLIADENMLTMDGGYFKVKPYRGDKMNPRVKEVKPIEGYQLLLTFTNNEIGIFDVSKYLCEKYW